MKEIYLLSWPDSLKRVEISDVAKTITFSAFRRSNIEEIFLGKNIERINDCAFENTKISEIKIPDKCKIIEKHAFRNCPNLYTIELGDGFTVIEDQGDIGEQTVTIIIKKPEQIRYIANPEKYIFKDKKGKVYSEEEVANVLRENMLSQERKQGTDGWKENLQKLAAYDNAEINNVAQENSSDKQDEIVRGI